MKCNEFKKNEELVLLLKAKLIDYSKHVKYVFEYSYGIYRVSPEIHISIAVL